VKARQGGEWEPLIYANFYEVEGADGRVRASPDRRSAAVGGRGSVVDLSDEEELRFAMKTHLGGLMAVGAVLLSGGLNGCASMRSPEAATVVSLQDKTRTELSTNDYIAARPALAALLAARKLTLVDGGIGARFVADVVRTEKNGEWYFEVADVRDVGPTNARLEGKFATDGLAGSRGGGFTSTGGVERRHPSFALLDQLEATMRAEGNSVQDLPVGTRGK
jgi:hypothetical protein